MNSQSPVSPPQAHKLSFFPASFPDETLLSRLSRYHLLTGERKDDNTFSALFGQSGTTIDFTELAPPSLSVLASLLPGDSMVQLGNILQENTLVPFAVPVIASSVEEFIGSEFGDSKACVRCLDEDEALVGVPYLHRSHQLPAVTACWKHGTKLIEACPGCEQPFRRSGKFLRAPITPCGCGYCVAYDNKATDATRAEHEFAIHAHCVLESRIGQTSLAVSVRFFQSQIEQSEFRVAATGKINRKLLTGLIEQQMVEGRTTTEIAMAAAAVMTSARKVNWWIASPSYWERGTTLNKTPRY